MSRLPHNDMLKGRGLRLLPLAMNVVETDNERNSVIAIHIVLVKPETFLPNIATQGEAFSQVCPALKLIRFLTTTGRVSTEALRPLVFQFVAKHVHGVRLDLAVRQLNGIITMVPTNLHDPNFSFPRQTNALRLPSNLFEGILLCNDSKSTTQLPHFSWTVAISKHLGVCSSCWAHYSKWSIIDLCLGSGDFGLRCDSTWKMYFSVLALYRQGPLDSALLPSFFFVEITGRIVSNSTIHCFNLFAKRVCFSCVVGTDRAVDIAGVFLGTGIQPLSCNG